MYLLTNENTTVAGIYRITIKRIKDDTGIPREEVIEALDHFSRDKKAFFIDEYIIIPRWPKHQKLGKRGKLRLAVNAIIKSLPENIQKFISQPGNYDYEVSSLLKGESNNKAIPHDESGINTDTLSKNGDENQIPYTENEENEDIRSSDLDLDSDHDLDLDKNSHIEHSDESDFEKEAQKLFIWLWQKNSDIFNSAARIESPKEWAVFWEKCPYPPDDIKRRMQNFIDGVKNGSIEKRFIPRTPDRFVLKGHLNTSDTPYNKNRERGGVSPPSNPTEKRSLGGLE
jgi:hypothetical protein